MGKLKSEKDFRKFHKGIFLDPAGINQQVGFVETNLICRYGKIQALKIAKIVYQNLEKIQDKLTESEENLITEEKEKRRTSLERKAARLRSKLAKLEGN